MSISSSNNSDNSGGADQPQASTKPGDPEFISKTVLKRDAEQLQKLGKRIAQLSNDQRAELQLPDKLLHAINEYNRFPSHEAKRRQLQYVGRVMRGLDIDHISERMQYLEGHSAKAKFAFHQSEMWRDRLIDEPEALAEYIDLHPQVDRQELRHTIKKVRTAKNPQQSKLATRVLFKFLRATEDHQD